MSGIRLGSDKVFGSNFLVQYPRPSHYPSMPVNMLDQSNNLANTNVLQMHLQQQAQENSKCIQKWAPNQNDKVEVDLTDVPV